MATRFWLRPLVRAASRGASRPQLLGPAACACGPRYFHASAPARADDQKNPYSVLGVAKGSSKEDIKKSYYKLVKKCVGAHAWGRAAFFLRAAGGGGAPPKAEPLPAPPLSPAPRPAAQRERPFPLPAAGTTRT